MISHKAFIKRIKEIRLMNDAFMSRVFEDNIEVQRADKGACEKRARYVLDFRLKKLRN